MSSAYEVLKNDIEINKLIDNTNYKLNKLINFVNKTTNKNYSLGCHGRYHTTYVVKIIVHILQTLSYDEHTIELGKIAGLLHDIGCTYGRFDHARIGGDMCVELFEKTDLALEDRHIIHHAIQDHSNGDCINSRPPRKQ